MDSATPGPPDEPESSPATEGEEAPSDGACPRCGTALSPGSQVCPTCGQKQFRACFCGVSFPADQTRCPACGTDWTKSVVRRRSRSDKVKPRALLRSALLGAFLALVLSGLLNLIITALAQRATPAGTVPAHMGERLYYAWYTLATAVTTLIGRLIGGLGYTLLIAVVGAVLGALVYILPGRLARLHRSHRHTTSAGRVRRRRSGH